MRDDMSKVIVERPRFKPRRASGCPPKIDADSDLPAFIGMKRLHKERQNYKTLNENLAPLKRYLFKQVGRPWNKVYSEISEHLRADNPVQQHVRDHLKDFVEINPRCGLTSRYSILGKELWWQPLYVHPDNGLLCRTDQHPARRAARIVEANKPKPEIDRVKVTTELELRLIDGLWYEVQMAPIPQPEYISENRLVRQPIGWGRKRRWVEVEKMVGRLITPDVRDIVTGKLLPAGPSEDNRHEWYWFRREHPERYYGVAKRSLSRRELKRHGLV